MNFNIPVSTIDWKLIAENVWNDYKYPIINNGARLIFQCRNSLINKLKLPAFNELLTKMYTITSYTDQEIDSYIETKIKEQFPYLLDDYMRMKAILDSFNATDLISDGAFKINNNERLYWLNDKNSNESNSIEINKLKKIIQKQNIIIQQMNDLMQTINE